MGCCCSSGEDKDEDEEEPSIKQSMSNVIGGESDGFLQPLLAGGEEQTSLRAHKPHPKGTRRHVLHTKICKQLDSGADFRDVVKLPEGEDLNGWIALHVVDFYNDLSAQYGTMSELCTPSTCPCMSAGPKYTYLWADGVHIKTPIKVPAPEYIDYLMEWVDLQITDPDLFPVEDSQEFSETFVSVCKVIFKRLFRVYAHIYHSHFTQFVSLGSEARLNENFKRFVFFILEFDMVSESELAPLQQLIGSLNGA